MKKRITALLLCLVMVFSLIPTTVWAQATVPLCCIRPSTIL